VPAKAVFLDKDGTIIPETGGRVADPAVQPAPGAVEALRKLRKAGFLLVVVTNQAGVARGLFTESELAAAHQTLLARFAAAGAPLDALYYCPHLPDGSVAAYAVECDCRKPKPGLLLRAARELDIDLAQSYLIGDAERDALAANAAGCKGIAIIQPQQRGAFTLDLSTVWLSGTAPWQQVTDRLDDAAPGADYVIVPDIAEAADWILEMERAENTEEPPDE